MQTTFLVVAGLTLLLSAIGYIQNQQPLDENSKAFQAFKIQFQRSYSQSEEKYRKSIFELNYAKILAHNADPTQAYKIGVNQFTDLSYEEFASIYLSPIPSSRLKPANEEFVEESIEERIEPNDQVDWRPFVTVEEQGHCDSSWAFSAVGTVEAYFNITRLAVNANYSKQQLIDCDMLSFGCKGGNPKTAFQVMKNYTLLSTDCYPYTGLYSPCKINFRIGPNQIKGFKYINKKTSDLAKAVKKYPVSVCIEVTDQMVLYSSGVFEDSTCGSDLNYCLVAVGYDMKGNWILKNSWGTQWGEKGFIRLKAGDTCGITQYALQPY